MKTTSTQFANRTLLLRLEGERFQRLAQEHLWTAYHRAGGINEADRRLIRDHEMRAETFTAAHKLMLNCS